MSSGELCVEEGGSMLPMKLPPIKYYLIALLCHCLPKCLLLVRYMYYVFCIVETFRVGTIESYLELDYKIYMYIHNLS